MSLLQRIKQDQIAARKAKDKFKASLLTTLLSEASRPGLDDGKRESTDKEVIAVVQKFIKNMKESLDAKYTEDVHTEMCIVNEYMPKQLTSEEMRNLTIQVIANNSDAKMGDVMKYFAANHKGSYDGKELSGIVRSILNTGS